MSGAMPNQPGREEPEAPPDLEDLLTETRSQKLEAQLKEWGIDLERLKVETEQAGAEAKVAFEKEAHILRAKMDDARVRLRELKTAGGAASHEMLKGLDSAWAELKKAFESAAAKFK